MGGGFGGFKDFEDEKGPNTDEDLQDDPLMQMDMPVSIKLQAPFALPADASRYIEPYHEGSPGSLRQ